MQKNEGRVSFAGPPALVLLISLLMIALMFLDFGNFENQNSAYAAMIALYAIIFGLPAAFYCFLKGRGFLKRLKLRRLDTRALGVTLLGTVMLILQSCILKFGVFYFGYDYSAYTLYGSSFSVSAPTAWSWILLVLSLAVVPALTEEVLFRGIVLCEYEKSGLLCSMLASSLLFASVHFDLAQFCIYFLDGMLLSWLVFLTGSVLSSVAAHILYNLFVLFFEKYIWLLSSNPDSELLFWLILIALYLLFAFFFFGAAERLSRRHADEEFQLPYSPPKERLGRIYFSVFTSKPMIAELAVFLAVSIIGVLTN